MDHSLHSDEIAAIKAGRAYLIDVRSDSEVAERSCAFALHWEYQQMVEGRFPKIPTNEPVFVFGHSNDRSSAAQRMLSAQGFTDVHNLGSINNLPQELL